MPAQIFIDTIDLLTEVVTVEPINLDGDLPDSYPHLRLKKSGHKETLPLQVIQMENAFLRVLVSPALGGRIISIFDKRNERAVLPPLQEIALSESGSRGLVLNQGIEFLAGKGDRTNALGQVDFRIQEAQEPDQPVGVLMHELVVGQRIAWHGAVTLDPELPVITVDLRVQNRGSLSHPTGNGFQAHLGQGWKVYGGALYSEERRAGLAIETLPSDVYLETSETIAKWHAPTARAGMIGPNRVEELKVRITPFSFSHAESTEFIISGSAGALRVGQTRLSIQVTEPVLDGKMFILTGSGQTLEAPANLYPQVITEIEFATLPEPPQGFVLRSADQTVLLEWDGCIFDVPIKQPEPAPGMWPAPGESWLESQLKVGAEDFSLGLQSPGIETACCWEQAIVHCRRKEWDSAQESLDKCLNYNAEDHLAWWLKAAIKREQGNPGDDRPELMNAHFLAPLEPVLRAEAFLSQPVAEGKEPNPVLRPVADNPDAALEVACLLIKAGFDESLARFVNECLRYSESPLLRYLLAYRLLSKTRMAASAAEHVMLAGRCSLEPPFPWRDEEWSAIRALVKAFPNDERLATLIKLDR